MTVDKVMLLAVILTVLVLGSEANMNLTIGHREPNDHVIEREIVRKDSKVLRVTDFTRTFEGDRISNITLIEVVDRSEPGVGANVELIGGGTGHKFVTFKFKSQRNHGIAFDIEIYGRYK